MNLSSLGISIAQSQYFSYRIIKLIPSLCAYIINGYIVSMFKHNYPGKLGLYFPREGEESFICAWLHTLYGISVSRIFDSPRNTVGNIYRNCVW